MERVYGDRMPFLASTSCDKWNNLETSSADVEFPPWVLFCRNVEVEMVGAGRLVSCLTLANLGRNTGFQNKWWWWWWWWWWCWWWWWWWWWWQFNTHLPNIRAAYFIFFIFFFRAVEQLNDFSLEGVNIKVSKMFITFYSQKQRSLNIQVWCNHNSHTAVTLAVTQQSH